MTIGQTVAEIWRFYGCQNVRQLENRLTDFDEACYDDGEYSSLKLT